MVDPIVAELRKISEKARVFVSMPWIEGLTPRVFADRDRVESINSGEAVERRHGVFQMDEAVLSTLDHGGLYGDAVFEGILVSEGQVFAFKEHLLRWFRSAEKLQIPMPYTVTELAVLIHRTIREVGFRDGEKGYLRPVVTRGFGNLGIHPKKCVAPTVYCVVSTITLYPPDAYETGIELSVARDIRRNTAGNVNPNIKSNNYLNNIFGLLETMDEGRLETMMLRPDGAVAEATADNIFSVERLTGWQDDPSRVVVRTPSPDYCLVGITRNIIMKEARALGYTVEERPDLFPIDFVGEGKEAFLSGTGAGLMPVVGVQGVAVGAGEVGPVTKRLLAAVRRDMKDPSFGLSIHADEDEVAAYMARPGIFER